jgi:hypothetical protein
MRTSAMWAGLAGVAALLAACGSSTTSSSSSAAAVTTTTTSTTPAAASTAHTPVVVLTPNHAKVGDTIHAVGSGYSPNVQVTGTICALDSTGPTVTNPLAQCDVVNTLAVTTDANGGFTADFVVKKFPPLPTGSLGYTLGFGVQGDATNSGGGALTMDK